MSNFERIQELYGEIHDLSQANAVLSWEQETYMPEGGANARAQQMATLSRLAHERLTSDTMTDLLNNTQPETDFAKAYLKNLKWQHGQATKIPSSLVEELSKAHNEAHHAWVKARRDSNFADFAPYLQKNIELARQTADCLGYHDHPYDALLDQYERGMTSAEIKVIFADLREQTLPLLKKILSAPEATDYSILERFFPQAGQEKFGLKVAHDLGLNPKNSRLDVTAHPFQTSFSTTDVRITTRYNEHYFPTALFGIWHETGHALYEAGSNPEFERTPLQGGTSLGVHESQSRMVENLICRSKAFWDRYFAEFQATFPEQAADLSPEAVYKAVNRVQNSLIRVEADEVTYNFHIMLRFELELALLEGSLAVKDLPEAWNAKMQEYLGITPPNDAEGVLQDIHWSAGLIGYFPTYSLGNILSCQLWHAASQDLGNLDTLILNGEAHKIMQWMGENVHQYGSMYTPREITQKASGEPLSAKYYVQYLHSKYSDIYTL